MLVLSEFNHSINTFTSNFLNVTHFLFYRLHYSNEKSTFLNIIGIIGRSILRKKDVQVTQTLRYGQ